MALGLIEATGLSTAMAALDAAAKTAEVTLVGCERVIGVDQKVSITLSLQGDVAAVQAAVQAGRTAGNRIGHVVNAHVIPRPSEELKIIAAGFDQDLLPANMSVKPEEN